MSDAPPGDKRVLVVQFLVPQRDRDGTPYPHRVRRALQNELEERFDGWSLAAEKPLAGAWRNPASGEIEYDRSWRYEVGIEPSRLAEFDAFLAGLARRLEQKAIWRVVYSGGEGRVIVAAEVDE